VAQKYWPADHWPTNHWPTDYWLGANVGNNFGNIAATVANATTTTDATESAMWPADYWATGYWPSGYWGAVHSGWLGRVGVAIGVNGTIYTVLGDFPTLFSSSSIQVDYPDITVGFGVAWTNQEFATATGSIAVTLEAAPFAGIGNSAAVIVFGSMPAVAGNATAAFTGTFVGATGNDGLILTTLQGASSAIIAYSLPEGSALGSLATTLDATTAAMSATAGVPTFTGNWVSVTEDASSAILGQLYGAGVVLFQWISTLDDVDCLMVCTSTQEAREIESVRGGVGVKVIRVGGAGDVRVGTRRRMKG